MSWPRNAGPPRSTLRASAVRQRLAGRDVVLLSIAAGLVAAVIVLIWLSVVLLISPGATERALLPVLLLVLPLLGAGAAAGWLIGLGLRALARSAKLDRG